MNGQERILILKPSSLGDIVHTLPVVHALKRCRPGVRIDWLVQRSFAPLVAADPCVDRVVEIAIPSTSEPAAGRLIWWQAARAFGSTWFRLRRQWRREPYDLILDLHGSLRGALLGRANPGGVRIGFADAREGNPLFQDQKIAVPPDVVHALDKNLLFCHHLDCPPEPGDFFLHCPEQALEKVRTYLENLGIDDSRVLVYGNPAARWASKTWPVEHWAELGDRLADQGMLLVLGGAAGDRPLLDAIDQRMHASPLVTAGDLDLVCSAALIRRCCAYVGLDSGPMHMAALSGVPVVALFGATHPDRVGPWGVAHRIVRSSDLDCLECRKRECASMTCMKTISAGRVESALAELLREVKEARGKEGKR